LVGMNIGDNFVVVVPHVSYFKKLLGVLNT
jgi:hypothetical protein